MEHYIGVTGITRTDEIVKIASASCLTKSAAVTPRIGFGLVHYLKPKMQKNVYEINYLKAKIELIKNQNPQGYPIVHLNGFSPNKENLLQAQHLAVSLPKSTIIQINKFDWTPQSLEQFREIFPENEIILPLNLIRTKIEIGLKLISTLSSNLGAILLDSSEGRGQSWNPALATSGVQTLRESFRKLHIAVAGGFGPDSGLNETESIKSLMPVSIDAESALHTDSGLDLKKVDVYLNSMRKLWED